MRTIEIKITKARIESFSVEFPEKGMPRVDAVLGLYTEGEKRVSEYRITSNSYYGNQVDMPMEVHTHLSNACEIIERVAHRSCNGELAVLESPKQRKKRETEEKQQEPEISTVPSFDDIPF